jgi:lipid-A-disaccharide synthase-like uncharacterized protein
MKTPTGKRLKWEPAAAMVLVVALGLWLAFGPASGPRFPHRKGATVVEIRAGDTRGILEYVATPAPGEQKFRRWLQREPEVWLAEDEVLRVYGKQVYARATGGRPNWVFRVLNITSWYNLVWVGIGFGGQALFSGRMVLQWLISEKRRESVVTESFWWFSLVGSVTLFSYFIWRQDPVAMVGQATGVVIYARNLRLIYKHKRRARRAAEAGVKS